MKWRRRSSIYKFLLFFFFFLTDEDVMSDTELWISIERKERAIRFQHSEMQKALNELKKLQTKYIRSKSSIFPRRFFALKRMVRELIAMTKPDSKYENWINVRLCHCLSTQTLSVWWQTFYPVKSLDDEVTVLVSKGEGCSLNRAGGTPCHQAVDKSAWLCLELGKKDRCDADHIILYILTGQGKYGLWYHIL